MQFGGIVLEGGAGSDSRLDELVARFGLSDRIATRTSNTGFHCQLDASSIHDWLPEFNSLTLADRAHLTTASGDGNPEKEILLAMLGGPTEFRFINVDSLISAIRVRRNIVIAARRTALNFDTEGIERPAADWVYHKSTGFTVRPGRPLIGALLAATQPASGGKRYAFSCYRATEYVILLSLAQEAADWNVPFLAALEQQWLHRAIASREFHDTFLHEYGTFDSPLPARYYVPGDRLWFRNPHEASSDVTGYEGSWVFYLGNGLFSNFWHPERPYSLASKCIEIFHWRNGLMFERNGTPYIDETLVDAHICKSLRDKDDTAAILDLMMRFRDPPGLYADGGCMDRTREYPRSISTGNEEVDLSKSAQKSCN